jgi:hypothetical protein
MYSGERARVRGLCDLRFQMPKPLTITLSPEYRAEGTRAGAT